MGRFSKLETHPTQAPPQAETAQEREIQGAEPVTFDGIMREADASFHTGDYSRALRLYSQALQEDNTRVEPWQGQVIALLLQSQVREADIWARRAAEAFPKHPAILSLHGLVFAMQGMTKRGLGTCDYAMGLAGPDPVCWVARGWILLEADNDNWRACFAKAGELAGAGNWRMEMLMGLILERYRKWVHAVEHFEATVRNQTSNFFLWHRLGVCQARLGLASKAVESQKHALEINPTYAPAEKELRRHGGFPVGALFARFLRPFSRPGVK